MLCGAKPRVTVGDTVANNLLMHRLPTYAEGNVMDLLNGMPRAARPTWPEGTREQIQMLFFDDLITAESHYLTTDSEVMQRREVPPAYYLMLSFPQTCIFFTS